MPSTQTTTKSNKKNTKRNNKNRNKRRRKLRQRKFQTKNSSTSPTKSKLHQKQNDQEQNSSSIITVKKTWETLCLETYQQLTTWQSEAELNFWKARAEWLQKENRELREQLKVFNKSDVNKNDKSKGDTEVEDTDAAYLEFINITHKHREELERTRTSEKKLEESNV